MARVRVGDEVRFVSGTTEAWGRVVRTAAGGWLVRTALGDVENIAAKAIVAVRPELNEVVRASFKKRGGQ